MNTKEVANLLNEYNGLKKEKMSLSIKLENALKSKEQISKRLFDDHGLNVEELEDPLDYATTITRKAAKALKMIKERSIEMLSMLNSINDDVL